MRQIRLAREQPGRLLRIALLVLGPTRFAIGTRVRVHHRLVVHAAHTSTSTSTRARACSAFLVGDQEAGEDEDGLDAELLEDPQVRLDLGRQGEREAAGGCEERLGGGGALEEDAEVVRGVDAEPGVAEGGERQRLKVPPLL